MDNQEFKEEIRNGRKEKISQLPQFRGEIPTKNNIRSLPNLKVGEIFWVTMDEQAIVVADIDKKNRVTLKVLDENASVSMGMTIYELNKKMVAQEPLFDFANKELVKEITKKVAQWFNKVNNNYYLLYGRDNHIVSLFVNSNSHNKSEFDIICEEAIGPVGRLISMDIINGEDDAAEDKIEIWIRTDTEDAVLLYLFPYDKGIINF